MASIKALKEILVEENIFPTTRAATVAINKGHVYVENVRVANPDALLVITAPTNVWYNNGETMKGARVGSEALA